MDYQNIVLVGNATDAAQVNEPKDKQAYADFTVAVSRNKDETDFFRVRTFGRNLSLAEKIEKGTKVLVGGRVEISNYQREGEDEMRTAVRVIAGALRLL